ncbi:RNAseH domain-containing protein [Kribbella sp. NBC_01245]
MHSRSQSYQRRGVPPRQVLTFVDIEASSTPGLPWPIRMWSDKKGEWIAQPDALADFHAGSIGSQQHGRGKKAAATRSYVEPILDALPPGPVVLFVDAPGTRSFWPGLQNQKFATALLPGLNLSVVRDLAIVRCNNSDEIPRPVDRSSGKRSTADARKPVWLRCVLLLGHKTSRRSNPDQRLFSLCPCRPSASSGLA